MGAFFSKSPLPVPPFQLESHCTEVVSLHVCMSEGPLVFLAPTVGTGTVSHASLHPQHLSWLYYDR